MAGLSHDEVEPAPLFTGPVERPRLGWGRSEAELPGVRSVFVGADGEVVDGLPAESAEARYRYDVDVSSHTLFVKQRLPDRDGAVFTVWAWLGWHVHDPVAVVRGRLANGETAVATEVSARIREIVEQYGSDERDDAIVEINATFGRGLVLLPEFTVEGLYSSLEAPDPAVVQRDLELLAPVRVIDMSRLASAADRGLPYPDESGLEAASWGKPVPPRPGFLFEDDSETTTQWVMVRTYLSEEGGHEEIERALLALLDSVGLEVEWMSRPEYGSWFRRYLIRAKNSAEVREQLAKIERVVDMRTTLTAQAQIDASQGDVVAKLVVALEKTPKAVIQVGSVLMVKTGAALVVRNLTQRELAAYERNPGAFRDPESALAQLEVFHDVAPTPPVPSLGGPAHESHGGDAFLSP